jgi:hypothetical protein
VVLQSSEGGVASVSLEGFGNHEEEGTKMSKSIAAWLDAEVSLCMVAGRRWPFFRFFFHPPNFAPTLYAAVDATRSPRTHG